MCARTMVTTIRLYVHSTIVKGFTFFHPSEVCLPYSLNNKCFSVYVLYSCIYACLYVCMYVCMLIRMYVYLFAGTYVRCDVGMTNVCRNIFTYACVRERCRLRMLTYFHAFPPAISFGYSTHFSQFAYSKLCMFVIDCPEICGYVLDAHGHGQPYTAMSFSNVARGWE